MAKQGHKSEMFSVRTFAVNLCTVFSLLTINQVGKMIDILEWHIEQCFRTGNYNGIVTQRMTVMVELMMR